jgi:hypothetical protein
VYLVEFVCLYGLIVNGWGYWGGGGYFPKGCWVSLDRGGLADMLEGVREKEKELCWFGEVLDLGGDGRREVAPCGGELGREAGS